MYKRIIRLSMKLKGWWMAVAIACGFGAIELFAAGHDLAAVLVIVVMLLSVSLFALQNEEQAKQEQKAKEQKGGNL